MKIELITLVAIKTKLTDGLYKGFYETKFYKPDGKLFATMQPSSKQPGFNSKRIILNCFPYLLTWETEK